MQAENVPENITVKGTSAEHKQDQTGYSSQGCQGETSTLSQWWVTLSQEIVVDHVKRLTPGIEEIYALNEMFGNNGGVTMKGKLVTTSGNRFLLRTDFTSMNQTGNAEIVEQVLDANGQVAGTRYKVTTNQVPVGNANPKLTGGLGTSLRYKNFSLYALARLQMVEEMLECVVTYKPWNGLALKPIMNVMGNGFSIYIP
ncbi:hypothetical protein FQR65_LT19607 [Abscondita terminalis]|nr:hypothetical protein FQR65_LT19607 [Abscondita terminalis]